MKSKCFIFLRDIVKIFKIKLTNESLIKNVSSVVDVCIYNLEYILTEKFEYLSKMSKDSKEFPDHNFELFIYTMLDFLLVFLTKSLL